MDVIVIFNGLGNQMSQYAFYLQKREIDPSTYLISFCKDHNGLEINTVFNIEWRERFIHKGLYLLFRLLLANRFIVITYPIKFLLKLLGCKIVQENFNYEFNASYLVPSKGITFYYGGWHNERYFTDVKDQISGSFQFTRQIDSESLNLTKAMSSCNSVALHVRRGDYLSEANINLFGKVCTKAYFEKAIAVMNDLVESPHFYVFSNDTDWVKRNLCLAKVTYVTHNVDKNSWRDLFLMSNCKHHIISNSTFSWWGAYLNESFDTKVISPSRFLNNDISSDVYPSHWIKITDY